MNNLHGYFKEMYKDYNWDLLFGPFKFDDDKLYYKEPDYITTSGNQLVCGVKTLILEIE